MGSRSSRKRKRAFDAISDIAVALSQPLPPAEDRDVALRRLAIERERIDLDRQHLDAQREMMKEVQNTSIEQTKLMLDTMRTFMSEVLERFSKK